MGSVRRLIVETSGKITGGTKRAASTSWSRAGEVYLSKQVTDLSKLGLVFDSSKVKTTVNFAIFHLRR